MNNISYSAYQLSSVAFQKLSVQPPVPLTGPMKGCISCSPSPTILLTIYNSWTTGTCPKQYAYQKLGLEKHYLWELAWRIFRSVISVHLSRSSEWHTYTTVFCFPLPSSRFPITLFEIFFSFMASAQGEGHCVTVAFTIIIWSRTQIIHCYTTSLSQNLQEKFLSDLSSKNNFVFPQHNQLVFILWTP